MTQFKAFLAVFVAWLGSGANWAALRVLVIEFLKSNFVRMILLKFFGSVVSGSYKAFIARVIVEYAFDELALPIVKLAFRKLGYVYHKTEGAIIFKRIEEAKAEDNEKKYDEAVDRLFRA